MAHSAAMRAVVVCAVAAMAIAGCSGDDANSGERPSSAGPTVTVPPSRLTPFCQEMIDLADRLETDESADPGALILDTYLSILDEVPDEIEEDFLVVIARLQRGELPDLGTGDAATGETGTDETGPDETGPDETAGPDGASLDAGTDELTEDKGTDDGTDDSGDALGTDGTDDSGDTGDLTGTQEEAEYQGWTPDDDPALRVNAYVDFVCRDNVNNPGPPATEPPPPLLEATTSDGGEPDTVEPAATEMQTESQTVTVEDTAGVPVDPSG